MSDLRPWETLSCCNIAHACFMIAIDNGGINRNRSIRKWRGDYERFIGNALAPLAEIDEWLGALTEARLEVLCTGEATEAEEVASSAPAFTRDILNRYFDEVC